MPTAVEELQARPDYKQLITLDPKLAAGLLTSAQNKDRAPAPESVPDPAASAQSPPSPGLTPEPAPPDAATPMDAYRSSLRAEPPPPPVPPVVRMIEPIKILSTGGGAVADNVIVPAAPAVAVPE